MTLAEASCFAFFEMLPLLGWVCIRFCLFTQLLPDLGLKILFQSRALDSLSLELYDLRRFKVNATFQRGSLQQKPAIVIALAQAVFS